VLLDPRAKPDSTPAQPKGNSVHTDDSPNGHGIRPGNEPRSDWVQAITEAWQKGAAHTLELALIVAIARKEMRRGEWAKLWKDDSMPFSQRKGEMLVVIGQQLGWANPQTFARLPAGWSVLYQLARFNRSLLTRLVESQAIHPRLTLREAKDLVSLELGEAQRTHPPARFEARLRSLRAWIKQNHGAWNLEDRDLIKREFALILADLETHSRTAENLQSVGNCKHNL
jgi:hypothetical protein